LVVASSWDEAASLNAPCDLGEGITDFSLSSLSISTRLCCDTGCLSLLHNRKVPKANRVRIAVATTTPTPALTLPLS
jgi:hypothetical protein